MRRILRFLGTLVGILVFLVVLLASFEPPDSFSEKSWLGVVNRWLFDSDWEQEISQDTYLLTKTSLTDDSLLLGIMCGLNKPTLAVIIISDPSMGSIADRIKLSFDEGPYFDERWRIREKQNVVVQGGDMAFVLLRRMLTSNVLRVRIKGRGVVQDDYKFYLEGLRKFEPNLLEYCRWEG